MLDQKGSDLVDRRRPTGDQSGPNAVTCLQVELILALLLDDAQVWPQRRFGNGFGFVVVVLLPFHKGFAGMTRGSCPTRAAFCYEVRAQTGFHANNSRRQLLERVFETQSPDLPAEGNLSVDAQRDEAKTFLPMSTPMTASDAVSDSIFGFMAASPIPGCSPAKASPVGEAAGPPHWNPTAGPRIGPVG
jgi:hypothetical protein